MSNNQYDCLSLGGIGVSEANVDRLTVKKTYSRHRRNRKRGYNLGSRGFSADFPRKSERRGFSAESSLNWRSNSEGTISELPIDIPLGDDDQNVDVKDVLILEFNKAFSGDDFNAKQRVHKTLMSWVIDPYSLNYYAHVKTIELYIDKTILFSSGEISITSKNDTINVCPIQIPSSSKDYNHYTCLVDQPLYLNNLLVKQDTFLFQKEKKWEVDINFIHNLSDNLSELSDDYNNQYYVKIHFNKLMIDDR
jgi:hypothetical protein